jgi:hypothetical protein
VPQEIHAKLDNADKIPLFQMIAKNVGIRRAKGKFVLATNIDVLFSDPLMTFLKHKLKTGSLYRVDRFDVPEQLPSPSNFEQILKFCSDNYFRINGRTGTINTRKTNTSPFQIIYNKINIILNCTISNLLKKFINTSINDAIKLLKRLIQKVICFCYPKNSIILHTNACGDFTLLSIDDWAKLKGYPEWSIFSWHIDSVLLYQAKQHGIKEIDLPRKMSIYHIEHEIGSGYSAEGAQTLFNRLETRGIPYLSNADLKRLITELNHSKEKVMYNDENWGFANIQLKEFIV